MINLILFWITLVLAQPFVHVFLIETMKRRPKYWVWALIRIGFAGLYLTNFKLFYIGDALLIFLFQGTSHFVLFNPTLNRLLLISRGPSSGIGFWYLGKDSGWFDRFFIKHVVFHRAFYFACFILMVMSALTIYEKYFVSGF